MKTIVEPKENIDKLWGKQKVREGETYRLMRYLLRVDHEDKVLLHNVVTGRLAVLEREEAEALNSLPAPYAPAMEQLVTEHYLVPQNFDEYRSVNQLRKILQSRETGDYINHYVILPTTYCNAHCFYCYESEYPRLHMTEETAAKLIEYIDEHHQGKKVILNWFGGEPLVGAARIDQICQGLKDRNIPFSSKMISNGYLFDEELIERCKSLWNLRQVQITLDGPEEVYNCVKAYMNPRDNPYQRVLNNIDLLIDKEIQVNIRLNVDFYNKDDIRALIEELGKRYGGKEHVAVYLNMLFNDQGYDPVHHDRDDMIELQQIIDDYTARLVEFRLGYKKFMTLSLQFTQCMADNVHAVEIQPDGSFCRCEHESIPDRYGSLSEGVFNPQKLIEWKKNIERADNCCECCLYPACYLLKHCMNADIPCTDKYQMKILQDHKAHVRSVYSKSLEGKQ